jgi:hypothetical protein
MFFHKTEVFEEKEKKARGTTSRRSTVSCIARCSRFIKQGEQHLPHAATTRILFALVIYYLTQKIERKKEGVGNRITCRV